LISPSDRVTVWQSQLAANDFPPVCAMCGQPAETWQKFNFSTAPPWAYWVGGVILATAMARRASGYLPLTRACAQKIKLVRWTFAGVLLFAFACWITALVLGLSLGSDATWSGIALVLLLVGILALLVGLVGRVLARRSYGPTAKVMDQQYGQYEPVVELQRVHPNFVMAVQQLQQARAKQYATGVQSPFQPGST
jgi:Na+-transporting methylmalonyl-CoA/oxaloacetate decarboxylase gamma subunit